MIHTWIQSHSMAFESVHERKWENCLQMDIGTTKKFEQIKNKLCTAPVLVLPYLHQPFETETDTSDYALGTMITQSSHPIVFHFETSNDTVRGTQCMKKKFTPLCKILSNGDTTFLAGKRSSSLTISLCSSLRLSQNYKQPNNSTRLITCNNFSS